MMKKRVEAPDRPILNMETFTPPKRSDKGPPTRAPTPYIRKLTEDIAPRVWNDAFRPSDTSLRRGGKTRKREWLRECAAPKMNSTALSLSISIRLETFVI